MAITTINSTDSGATSRTVINDNFTDLDTTKADLASPTFTGTPTLPTGTVAVTQTAGDNTTAVATTAFVTAAASPITVETTTGTTHSLTTTAGQKVIVWAKGSVADNANDRTILLKYNGVTKDTTVVDAGGGGTSDLAWSAMYTETPGAATQNVTVTCATGSLFNTVIIIMKIG